MVDPIKANRDNYALQLDMLQVMARRDLLALWSGDPGESWHSKTIALNEMYPEIVHDYGLQAAAAAADYVFIQRSLDDELSLLAYPDLAEPVDRKQALAGLNWALKDVRREQTEQELQAARVKAEKVLTRLVLQPARDTVYYNAEKAGARFLVMPSPRACAFCLMLASRGAVYHDKDRVGGWHDGCRCIGIEGNPRDERTWPRINRELEHAWYEKNDEPGVEEFINNVKKFKPPKPKHKEQVDNHPKDDYSVSQLDMKRWEYLIRNRRRELREHREFPALSHLQIPPSRDRSATLTNGDVLQIPPTHQFVGHVLYGWRSDMTTLEMFTKDYALGHTSQSTRANAGKFPARLHGKKLEDQHIVDMIHAALDAPGEWTVEPRKWKGDTSIYRTVLVDGYPVKTQFFLLPTGATVGLTSYPGIIDDIRPIGR